MKPLYEKPTMELRQIRGTMNYVDVVLSVQQKWIVADGEPYVASSCAIADMPNGIHPKYGLYLYGHGSYDSVWQRLKEEWRDLPVATPMSLL